MVIAIAVSASSDGDAITVCETTFAIGSAVRIATSIAAFTSEILPRIFTQAPAPRRFLSTPWICTAAAFAAASNATKQAHSLSDSAKIELISNFMIQKEKETL